jgi:hypothetical protein
MTERTRRREVARARTVGELQELIAALDRRVPQVQRAGEAAIARAAAALRVEALERIAELQRDAGAGGMTPASGEGLCPVECPPRR